MRPPSCSKAAREASRSKGEPILKPTALSNEQGPLVDHAVIERPSLVVPCILPRARLTLGRHALLVLGCSCALHRRAQRRWPMKQPQSSRPSAFWRRSWPGSSMTPAAQRRNGIAGTKRASQRWQVRFSGCCGKCAPWAERMLQNPGGRPDARRRRAAPRSVLRARRRASSSPIAVEARCLHPAWPG